MTASGEQVAPDTKISVETGARYREMNAILATIRRRRFAEPTPAERDRLATLKTEIARIKKGQVDA